MNVILLPYLPVCDTSQVLGPTDEAWLRQRMAEYAREGGSYTPSYTSTPGGTGVPTTATLLFVPVVPPRRRSSPPG